MKTSTSLTILGLAALCAALLPPAIAKSPHSIELTAIGSVAAGEFLKSAAEIAAHILSPGKALMSNRPRKIACEMFIQF